LSTENQGDDNARYLEWGFWYERLVPNAGIETAEQLFQRSLPVKEGSLAQILAIMLDQVEGS
jgi:hypothetical protein